jgi:hypothetical protein
MSTEDRLRAALRDGDRLSPPATPVTEVMRRGRRRRTRRRVASAAGVLAVVLAVPSAVVSLRQPEVLLAPGPAATSTETPSPGPTSPETPSPAPAETSPSPAATSPAGSPSPLEGWSTETVLVYQPMHAGVVLLDGDRREQVWEGTVLDAFADGEGGIVLQEAAGDPTVAVEPGPIVHLRADGTAAVLLESRPGEELEAVVTVDAHRHAAITRRTGEGMQDTVVELVLLPLAGGEERVVGVVGGWESEVSQLTHHQGLYAFLRCEAAACVIEQIDELGGTVFTDALPEGVERAAVALSPDGRWLFQALDDGADGTRLTLRDLALEEDRLHGDATLHGVPVAIDAGGGTAGSSAGPPAALVTVLVLGEGHRTDLLRWEEDGESVTRIDAEGITRFLHP